MNASNIMSVKQTLKCGIHSPEKWQEDYNGFSADDVNNLPNLSPTKVYAVDDYPACPDNWEHGSDITGSYFVGLAEDGALWLDLNECFDHTHDVAVVLSVQGINPITGQTLIGDNPLRMEQYHKNCPVHNTPFKQDCFCDDCGFSWPGQNYMATTGTPFGMFWLDGFRTPDGNVRQYVISAEKIKGVAAQVMKNPEDRVFAIGVAFYLSKDKKPDMPKAERNIEITGGTPGNGSMGQPMFFSPMHTPQSWNVGKKDFGGSSFRSSINCSSASCSSMSRSSSHKGGQHTNSVMRATANIEPQMISLNLDMGDIDDAMVDFDGGDDALNSLVIDAVEAVESVSPVKKLEVGAGALVSQRIYDDPKNLKKYWEETPAGMIYINYCDKVTLKKILDGGKKATKKDGFLNGIQIG